MPALVPFDAFIQELGRGGHNLNGNTFKVMLTNVAPNQATGAVTADITEIAAGNGYVAGGTAIGGNSYSQVAGVATFDGGDVTFTASGGAIATWRYGVIVNTTVGKLVAYGDTGGAQNIGAGNAYVFKWNALGIAVAEAN
jgi:hypothetical protein